MGQKWKKIYWAKIIQKIEMASAKVYRFYIWMSKSACLYLTTNAPREFSQFHISTIMSGVISLKIHSSFIKLIHQW